MFAIVQYIYFDFGLFGLLLVLLYFAYMAHMAHHRSVVIESQLQELSMLNAKLELARDQAVEGSRLKSEFVANISHEIRTPMSAVLGTIGLLQETNLNEEKQKDIAGLLQESAKSLIDVINDILDFSKIEAGKMRIQIVDFSPASVIKDVSSLVYIDAYKKKLTLTTMIDSTVPELLRGDSLRLRQILLNLVSNAVKFTAAGGITIAVLPERAEADRLWLRFSVKDTGIGIGDEVKHRLFKPFVQAGGSTTGQFGGTGLGLSISKRLAELMGGDIELESKLGEGSTLSLLLPFASSKKVTSVLLPPSNHQLAADLQFCRTLAATGLAASASMTRRRNSS